jgi:uncharacterized protein involved in propanediol utilization
MSPVDQRRPGAGSATSHHGEILQGVFHDDTGRLRRGLVTLRHPGRESRATFYPSAQQTAIMTPPGMWKVQNAAASAMAAFATERSPVTGGRIEISSTVPRGIGMGSSTADVTAAICAIADFHGASPSAEAIGRVAVGAERASDPVMINDRVVLFAHRAGAVLETMGHHMPPMIVVGCNADPATSGVDTVALTPAGYSDTDVGTFRVLRAELRAAISGDDVARLGRVATASAMISQRFLAKPAFEFLLDVNRQCGGCGVQVAHSGTVAGVIFDARQDDVARRVERCAALITLAGLPLTDIIGPCLGAGDSAGSRSRIRLAGRTRGSGVSAG